MRTCDLVCALMCMCVRICNFVLVYIPTIPPPYHSAHGETSSPWPGRPHKRHSRCCRPSVDRSSRGEEDGASALNKIHIVLEKKILYYISVALCVFRCFPAPSATSLLVLLVLFVSRRTSLNPDTHLCFPRDISVHGKCNVVSNKKAPRRLK